MRAPWLLVAVCVLAATPVAAAPGSPCAAECLEQGKAFGWSKAAKKACRASCKQQQKKCRELPKADRGDCRDRNADCAAYCATTWADADAVGDRTACQAVCGSCYRAATEFCVDVRSTDFVARCCGFAEKPHCCPQANPAGYNQCVNLSNDENNCGQCGRACDEALSQVCNAGTCMALPSCPGGCAAGLVCCATDTVGGGRCVSLQTDHDNCGTCGTACGASQKCEAGSCVQACVNPVFPVPCAASGPISPSCCAPEDKCCPGDYGFNSCWSPQHVNETTGSNISSKDEIQCCQTSVGTPQTTVTRGCPSTYSCCFATQEGGISSCCPPGFVCNAFGSCDPP